MFARIVFISCAAAAALVATASAQHAQPYAGLQARPIKALSDEETADIRAGRGMGLALAAELNGYPGPSHVVELADPLGLSAGQRRAVEALFAAMRAETVPIGEALIAQEAALDRQFAERTITVSSLNSTTAAVGATAAALRAAHLRYHLLTLDVLTPDQARRYAELRGYSETGTHPAPAQGHGTHSR